MNCIYRTYFDDVVSSWLSFTLLCVIEKDIGTIGEIVRYNWEKNTKNIYRLKPKYSAETSCVIEWYTSVRKLERKATNKTKQPKVSSTK